MLFGDHLGLFAVKELGATLVSAGFSAEHVFYNKCCTNLCIFQSGLIQKKNHILTVTIITYTFDLHVLRIFANFKGDTVERRKVKRLNKEVSSLSCQ